jgi:DNA-directed RNA polymerase subunit RPC12/RpoP
LIPRNTTIPTQKSQIFSTAQDNQTSVEVHVLQGEREMAADNKTLGRFHLVGIPPAPRGIPQIEVKFDIDANGIVNVSAKDLATGKKQQIVITSSSGVAADDVETMVEDADKFRKEDKKRRKVAELRNQADALVYSTEKAIEELGDKLDQEKMKQTERAVMRVKRALEGKDVKKLKMTVDELTELSQDLFATMYAEAARRGYDEEEEEIEDTDAGYQPVLIDCPKCGSEIKVESPERPIKIKCPNCGAKGTLRADVELPATAGKKGKEKAPPPPEEKEEAKEEASVIDCPKCGSEIEVESTERPLKIKCPKCGAKGTLKDEGPPKKKAKAKPPKEEEDEKQLIDCPACGGEIEVPSKKRPIKIECPKCGKKGTLKK